MELTNRYIGRRAAYRFSIKGSARNACISHDMRSHEWGCFRECVMEMHASVDSTRAHARSHIIRGASGRVRRVYSCLAIRRTQTASQLLRTITAVDGNNYATTRNAVFARIALDKVAT